MTTIPSDPAFGHPFFSPDAGEFTYTESGLTKREYFAAAALQGFLAGGAAGERRNVRTAVELADMLIAELSK